MANQSYRELSKTDWVPTIKDIDAINAGSLQRIADASEKTAAGFEVVLKRLAEAEKERDHYKSRNSQKLDEIARLERTISNLRGQITKLKKK